MDCLFLGKDQDGIIKMSDISSIRYEAGICIIIDIFGNPIEFEYSLEYYKSAMDKFLRYISK